MESSKSYLSISRVSKGASRHPSGDGDDKDEDGDIDDCSDHNSYDCEDDCYNDI